MAKKKPAPKPTLKPTTLSQMVVALEKQMRKSQAGMASVVLRDKIAEPKLAVILVDGPYVLEALTKLGTWTAESERVDSPDAPSEGANPV